MKKIFSLFLCIALMCAMLVGCGEKEIGSYLPNYPEDVSRVDKLTLNLYIVVEDNTHDNAITTVQRMIKQHTESKYSTILNVHYVKAAEYNEKVLAAANAQGENMANIVLINSESLLNSLMNTASGNRLCDISTYLDSRDFGTLNTQIPTALLEGSKVNGRLYTLPNSRVIGDYEYLVIDKEIARDVLKFSPTELMSYKSLEDAAPLIEAMNQNGYNASELVYIVSGKYELRAELEADNNYVNIATYPTVTKEFAFASCFGIINNPDDKRYNDRAMQILFALNNDVYLRNLLQYGVEGTNYTVVDNDVKRVTYIDTTGLTGEALENALNNNENVYNMNLFYTGDVFNAYFCSELGWVKSVYDNGLMQNKDSVVQQ